MVLLGLELNLVEEKQPSRVSRMKCCMKYSAEWNLTQKGIKWKLNIFSLILYQNKKNHSYKYNKNGEENGFTTNLFFDA